MPPSRPVEVSGRVPHEGRQPISEIAIEWTLAGPHRGTLRWVLEFNGRSSRALLVIGEAEHQELVVIEEPCRVSHDAERGLWHADLPGRSDSGVPLLAATWRQADAGPELLFARTSLLSELGVPGGCAEVASITLRG